MGRNLQSGRRLRPVDLARGHGLSTQAVRNYEEAGILPAADRTPSGYRAYTPAHAAALRAFLALVPGHGHASAASVMRAVNRGDTDEALRLVDESHSQLLDDRRTLRAVEGALRDLGSAAAPGTAEHQQDQDPDLAEGAVGGQQLVLPLVVGESGRG
ncbi:MerR family DNA-binding transcriptional regulator, partial [Streptomyces zhihengii]|uniref:MerR family DNA-binding transcriptional regulator n=1 Tax=Streptomyces zhihengii TaxID=1818004 RepID=UPI003454F24A